VWPFNAQRGSARGRDKVCLRGNAFGSIDPLAAPSGNDRYLRTAVVRRVPSNDPNPADVVNGASTPIDSTSAAD
jgi:hypothetical protein